MSARPITSAYVISKALARNRGVALATACVFAVIGVAVFFHLGREARAARVEARLEGDLMVSRAEGYAQRGEWQAALDTLEAVLDLGENAPALAGLKRVEALLALGDSPAAAAALDEAERARDASGIPPQAEFDYWRAHTLTGRQNISKARELLQDAVDAGDLAELRSLVARATLTDDPDIGLALLEDALAIRPFDHSAVVLQARLSMLSGRPERATELLSAAVRMFPGDGSIRVMLFFNLARQERGEEAAAVIDEIASKGNVDLAAELRTAAEGIELGQSYYTALWDFENLLKRVEFLSFVPKLRADLSARDLDSLPSLAAENMLNFAQRDFVALSRFYANFGRLSYEDLFDQTLAERPPSLIAASLIGGNMIKGLVGVTDDEDTALRYCQKLEALLDRSTLSQMVAMNLEACALARFLHGMNYDSRESIEKALLHTKRRLDHPLPLADMPAWALLQGCRSRTDDDSTTAQLARHRHELKPESVGRLFELCDAEIADGRPAEALRLLSQLQPGELENDEQRGRYAAVREGARAAFDEAMQSVVVIGE